MSVFLTPGEPGSDRVIEGTSETYVERAAGGFVGAAFGLLLFCAATGVLIWNENRSVEALRALSQAARDVTEVIADKVDPAQDDRLVHVTGQLKTQAALRDPATGMSERGLIRLRRTVEMFQWKESRQSTSGTQFGTETSKSTYSYAKKWSEEPINSSRFKAPRHENPAMPIRTEVVTARDATVGARILTPALLDRMESYEPLVPPAQAPAPYLRTADGLYKGHNPEAPEIGDIRVTFTGVPVQTVSVLAAQQGERLTPFRTKRGYEVGLVTRGDLSAATMVAQQRSNEKTLTWVLRGGGFVLFALSLMLMASPLATLAGVLPFLTSIVGGGILIFAFSLAVPLTLATVGLAWVAFRPLLGLTLLLMAGLLVYGYRHLRRAQAQRPATSPVPSGSVPAA